MADVVKIEHEYAAAQQEFGESYANQQSNIQRCRELICRLMEVYDPEYIQKALWLATWAARNGKLHALKRLAVIDHSNILTRRTFDRLMLENNSEAVVQWLLEQQADLYTTHVVRWAVTHGKCGLLAWVFQSFLPVQADAESLLRKSVRTALWTAAPFRRDDIIQRLLEWTPTATDPQLWYGIPNEASH